MIARSRYKLGVWLLMPALHAEARMASDQAFVQRKTHGFGPAERYWTGRFTALARILDGRARRP